MVSGVLLLKPAGQPLGLDPTASWSKHDDPPLPTAWAGSGPSSGRADFGASAPPASGRPNGSALRQSPRRANDAPIPNAPAAPRSSSRDRPRRPDPPTRSS